MNKERILDIIFAITHPNHWLRNDRASAKADKWLKKVMENDAVKSANSYVAELENGQMVWVGNYPYSYGQIWYQGGNNTPMPYRRTVYKFKKYLERKSEEDMYGED